MKILYGTTNNGKLQAMKNALKDFDIELIGLNDVEGELPTIREDGITPLENAELKARAYFEAFHIPVFSCDSGLYFEELLPEEQPGLHVRRVNGKELTDDEMVEYYAALAEKHGGKITGRYRNAIYFILDEEHHYSGMDMSIATEPFVLVAKPHSKRVNGFPLDSLSVDIATGKYYYDLEVKDVSTSVDDGVRAFFTKAFAESERRDFMATEEKNYVYRRSRSVAIVIRDGKILMERVFYFGREFFTVPGGGIEEGETPEQAVLRELKEECGLDGKIVRPLAVQYKFGGSAEYSFEVEITEDQEAITGYDPEDTGENPALKEVLWMSLNEISEKDRAFLWFYGLLSVGEFFEELKSWGNEISYPENRNSL